jgi:LysM repeat protein
VTRIVVIALLVLAAPRAHAQDGTGDTINYRVKQGDHLELIAAEFYGDRTKAVFIMVENRILHPRPLRPGERLRIPVSRPYTTVPGDSWVTLAATFLGDARRGTFLAEFNGLSPDDSLAGGAELSIPFVVTHVAQAPESLGQIAAAYFGDAKNAEMLRRYNFLAKDALEKGEALKVPVYNVRLSASKMPAIDADSKARRERGRQAAAKAARALPAARLAWKAGDYAGVKAALAEVELDIDYLDTAQAIDVSVLVGATHVAYNDIKPALESFKRVIERKATYQLDPYYFSPKIMAVWNDAHAEGNP